MFEKTDLLVSGQTIETDVCIIGGGPAAIALALKLNGANKTVLLFDAGGLKHPDGDQTLYEGYVSDSSMHSPPDKYRLRAWGGTSRIWAGRCAPFDAHDFEHRPHIKYSGWPFGFEELKTHYAEANEFLELGHFAYDAQDESIKYAPDLIPGFTDEQIHCNSIERFSRPTNVAQRYHNRLKRSKNLHIWRGSNCTALESHADGSHITRAHMVSAGGAKFSVKAKQFVLAAGGLETTRLLLHSDQRHPGGMGNENDLLGRFYMSHLSGTVGCLQVHLPPTAVHHGYFKTPDGIYGRRRIQLNADTQHQLGIGNAIARLHFPSIPDPSHHNSVLSSLYLSRHLLRFEYRKRLQPNSGFNIRSELAHIHNIAHNPMDVLQFGVHMLARRTLARRKFPSVILKNRDNRFCLEIHSEQNPNPDSTVKLAQSTDRLGMRKLSIDWRYQASDIDTVQQTLHCIAQSLKRRQIGTLDFQSDEVEAALLQHGAYGGHHLGTTRMGNDPKYSVVNRHCRLHAISNLYIASGSVFPTSSQANPTLTIVALAMRLGQHIKQLQD